MTKRCFVIMPFSDTNEKHTEEYWTDFFSKFIKPSVEKYGYSCRRSQAQPANIIKNILTELMEADLVLAILTDFNANVWYELGIRHGRRRGTIMIIEKGQKLPFDISLYGVIQYQDTTEGKAEFEKELKRFIEGIEYSQSADNPVAEFLELVTEDDYLELQRELGEIRIQSKEREQNLINEARAANYEYRASIAENERLKAEKRELVFKTKDLESEISRLQKRIKEMKEEKYKIPSLLQTSRDTEESTPFASDAMEFAKKLREGSSFSDSISSIYDYVGQKADIRGKSTVSKSRNGVIYIGHKPIMSYVLEAVTMFNQGCDTVVLDAKGRAISKAVDVAELINNKFIPVKVKNITTGSAKSSKYDGDANISYIEIELER